MFTLLERERDGGREGERLESFLGREGGERGERGEREKKEEKEEKELKKLTDPTPILPESSSSNMRGLIHAEPRDASMCLRKSQTQITLEKVWAPL